MLRYIFFTSSRLLVLIVRATPMYYLGRTSRKRLENCFGERRSLWKCFGVRLAMHREINLLNFPRIQLASARIGFRCKKRRFLVYNYLFCRVLMSSCCYICLLILI